MVLVMWAGHLGGRCGLGRCQANRAESVAAGEFGINGQKKRVRRRVSTGAEGYEREEGAKLLHGGGVFFSGVSRRQGADLADWEHAERKREIGRAHV